MNVRPEIQVQLDALAEMLVHWMAKVRHPAYFWPQFEMLAGEILDQCTNGERAQACARIQAMLRQHALELPAWHEREDSVPTGKPGT
jgi:hypothetical protein